MGVPLCESLFAHFSSSSCCLYVSHFHRCRPPIPAILELLAIRLCILFEDGISICILLVTMLPAAANTVTLFFIALVALVNAEGLFCTQLFSLCFIVWL